MYSPKIDERLIPTLYKLRIRLKKPMTKIVNEMIREALTKYEYEEQSVENNNRNTRNVSYGENKVLCPVCKELQPAKKMRDIVVRNGRRKHLLAICDDCYEKHVRPKLEKQKSKDLRV